MRVCQARLFVVITVLVPVVLVGCGGGSESNSSVNSVSSVQAQGDGGVQSAASTGDGTTMSASMEAASSVQVRSWPPVAAPRDERDGSEVQGRGEPRGLDRKVLPHRNRFDIADEPRSQNRDANARDRQRRGNKGSTSDV